VGSSATLVRTIFDQPDPAEITVQFDQVVTALVRLLSLKLIGAAISAITG
jgi:hypothetical protein